MAQMHVLFIGLEPTIIDFTGPAFADKPGVNAETIQAGIDHDVARLRELGYGADFCAIDYGATASEVVRKHLAATTYECVAIGAGIRLFPDNTVLFEQLVNLVHAEAPQAKFCFNTTPRDTADAVQRVCPIVT